MKRASLALMTQDAREKFVDSTARQQEQLARKKANEVATRERSLAGASGRDVSREQDDFTLAERAAASRAAEEGRVAADKRQGEISAGVGLASNLYSTELSAEAQKYAAEQTSPRAQPDKYAGL